MPTAIFENNSEKPLRFVVSYDESQYEIPSRGQVGIRYNLETGEKDQTMTIMGDGEIEFWCNSVNYEIDIVPPSKTDLLLYELCVIMGFCGWSGDHIMDFIPKAGIVNATIFAQSAFLGDKHKLPPQTEREARWFEDIKSLFIKYYGDNEIPTEQFLDYIRLPFESESV